MAQSRRTRRILVYTLLALVSVCAVRSRCQETPDNFAKKVRVVPNPVKPTPFVPTRVQQNPVYTVTFENADQLSPNDRLLMANAESTIGELTRSSGLEFSSTQWKYSKIVCPAFPDHLFLRFSRDSGRGDVSVFSASIPRNGTGRIRVIPILRRSYSLFSPAPINAITISAFNHIRSEESQAPNDDWLGNALCYAALAGAQPQIVPGNPWPSPQQPVPPLSATLDVQSDQQGQQVVSFDDNASPDHPMEWTMTFTRKGRLIKATHKPVAPVRAQPVPQTSAVTISRPVP